MSEDKKIRHHMKSIKDRANAPNKRSKSSQLKAKIKSDKEPGERDGNASEGNDPVNPEEDFTVPEGRRKRKMQRYCRKFCKVDLVVEERSEKDSWKSVSKRANANKESKTNQRGGIKFKFRSVRSQG